MSTSVFMSLPSVDGEESAPKRTSSFKLPSVRSASVDPVLSGTQSARQGRNRDSSDRLPRLQSERVRSHKRSRSLLPPITGENKGKNDSDDIAALASPVGLNGTKLLHQLSRDTFYRDGRPRRHSGASTSTASTKRLVVPKQPPKLVHAHKSATSAAGTHLQQMVEQLRREEVKAALVPWLNHFGLLRGANSKRSENGVTVLKIDELRGLARAWKLHQAHPGGPVEFWSRFSTVDDLVDVCARHAATLGPPPQHKMVSKSQKVPRLSTQPNKTNVASSDAVGKTTSSGKLVAASVPISGGAGGDSRGNSAAADPNPASFGGDKVTFVLPSRKRESIDDSLPAADANKPVGSPNSNETVGLSTPPIHGQPGKSNMKQQGATVSKVAKMLSKPKAVTWGEAAMHDVSGLDVVETVEDVEKTRRASIAASVQSSAVTAMKHVFTGDATAANLYASRMMPPPNVNDGTEEAGVRVVGDPQLAPTPRSIALPSPGPNTPMMQHMFSQFAPLVTPSAGGGYSFAATATALAMVVKAKYKAASFDPEAPKYFLPAADDDLLMGMGEQHSRTKQRLAATIRNLSSFQGGEVKLVREGALAALFELAVSDDVTTLRHVAAALCNLSCCRAVRVEMADCGVVVVLNGLAEHPDEELLTDVTATFVNLLSEVYCDTPVIRDGGLRVIIKLASSPDQFGDVIFNCVSCILKLTCSKDNFARLTSEGAPKVLVTMMAHPNEEIRRMTLSALVFLSCFTGPRSRLLADGIVRAITSLSAVATDNLSAQQLSLLLEHLGSDEAALQVILDEGCVQALVNIAAMGDEQTTISCGSALAELAMRPVCFAKVVSDNGIPSIVSLAFEQSVVLREKCAMALCNLSTYPQARPELLKADAIDALVSISGTGTDLSRRIVSVALCNLVTDMQSEERVEVERRAIKALTDLAQVDVKKRAKPHKPRMSTPQPPSPPVPRTLSKRRNSIRSSFIASLGSPMASPNLRSSLSPESPRKRASTLDLVLEEEGVTMVEEEEEVVAIDEGLLEGHLQCARALCELSLRPRLRGLIIDENGLPAFAAMLAVKNRDIAVDCLTALSRLSQSPLLPLKLMSVGGVGDDIAYQKRADAVNKPVSVVTILNSVDYTLDSLLAPLAAETLCNVSCCLEAIPAMVIDGVMSIVAVLRTFTDPSTRDFTARLLFNLASHSKVRETVFKSGGIHALTSCAQAGGEHIKRKCVQAIELLTRCDDPEGVAMKEGAFTNLMIIMLFRSDDITTKYACAMALFNIAANATSRRTMVSDGVVWSLVKAARESGSESLKKICARFISNVFCDRSILNILMENRGIASLITISGASNPTTKLWAATTLRQLSWHPRLLPKLVSEGVVPALVHLVMTSQGKCQQECAEALCHISCCSEGREALIAAHASKATAILCHDRTEHIMYSCAVILNNMSSIAGIHQQLIDDGLMMTLSVLATAKFSHTLRMIGRTLHNISCSDAHRASLIQDTVVIRPISPSLFSAPEQMREDAHRGKLASTGSFSQSPNTSGGPDTASKMFTLEAPAQTPREQLMIVIEHLCKAKALETRGWCVSALANLSWQPECQVVLAKAGAIQVAASAGLAGNGKFVRRHLAVMLCNLSRHPDAFRQAMDDHIVDITLQMVKAQRDLGNLMESWTAKPKLKPPPQVLRNRPSLSVAIPGAPTTSVGAQKPLMTPSRPALKINGSFRAPAGQIPRGILKTAATPTGAGGHAAFGGFSSVTGGSFRGFSGLNTGAAEVGKRPKLVTSEDMDGPGRDIVVDTLMSRTFRNLLARPALAAEIITNSELLPGLLDLADAVTDIALGNADGANDRSVRMLRMRQRDLSAVQDCSSAFASMTWHVDCHQMMIQQRAVPTLLEMSKLDDQLVHSNVAIALCNLCHSDDVTNDLVECGVVPVLIALAKGKSDDVKRRCAAALDKLSSHPTVQEALMDASVMKSLVGLVGTRDKLALLETPHRSLPPLLAPPPSLVPKPEMADPLPPLPPRGDNFDDNISNKLLNQAFTRSARNLLGGTMRNLLAAQQSADDDSEDSEEFKAFATPHMYDDEGNFKVHEFPRALQPIWDQSDIEDNALAPMAEVVSIQDVPAHAQAKQLSTTPRAAVRQQQPPSSPTLTEGDELLSRTSTLTATIMSSASTMEPVTMADHIAKRANAITLADDEKWSTTTMKFVPKRGDTSEKRAVVEATGDPSSPGRLLMVEKRGILVDEETPLQTGLNLDASPVSAHGDFEALIGKQLSPPPPPPRPAPRRPSVVQPSSPPTKPSQSPVMKPTAPTSPAPRTRRPSRLSKAVVVVIPDPLDLQASVESESANEVNRPPGASPLAVVSASAVATTPRLPQVVAVESPKHSRATSPVDGSTAASVFRSPTISPVSSSARTRTSSKPNLSIVIPPEAPVISVPPTVDEAEKGELDQSGKLPSRKLSMRMEQLAKPKPSQPPGGHAKRKSSKGDVLSKDPKPVLAPGSAMMTLPAAPAPTSAVGGDAASQPRPERIIIVKKIL